MSFGFTQADAVRIPLPDASVDFVFGSPPYCDARTYGIDAQRNAVEWVGWMLRVTAEAVRVSRGPVVWIAAGVTRDRNYWPACEGLMWEWFKAGGSAYRPCFWHRVGIPGSGGKDWFRADVEYAMCFKKPGPLAWSDNTANGHPPKWTPGGEMSHRLSDGTRKNQWGSSVNGKSTRTRNANGEMTGGVRPSHRTHAKRMKGVNHEGGTLEVQNYTAPAMANPGNLIRGIPVGGGLLGNPLAHDNEAPFPEALAEWFIKSLCRPRGTVLDPFSGSGTTAAVADRLGRHGIGLDIRRSQCELGKLRCERPHAPVKAMAAKEEAFVLKGLE